MYCSCRLLWDDSAYAATTDVLYNFRKQPILIGSAKEGQEIAELPPGEPSPDVPPEDLANLGLSFCLKRADCNHDLWEAGPFIISFYLIDHADLRHTIVFLYLCHHRCLSRQVFMKP